MPSALTPERLKDEIAKYTQAREQLTTRIGELERTKAQALAQLNALIGAVEALTQLLPSEPAPQDDTPSAAVLTDEPAATETPHE